MTSSNQTAEKCLFLEIQDVSGKPLIKFTAIATSVIGLLSAIGSVFGNALVLYVIAKFSRLQTPSNILLCNLCITDFITGLIVVPTISIRRITEAYGNGICAIRLICAYFAYLTVIVSIVTVCIISIDRYFAIMRPFQYQRTITVSRYIITICILWLILCSYSGLPFLRILSGKLYFEIAFIVMTLTILVFFICYARISMVARSHRRKLQHSIASSRQEAISSSPPSQSTCNMSTAVSRFGKQGIKNNGLCTVKLSSVTESNSGQFNVHESQQECQEHRMKKSSLIPEVLHYNKVFPAADSFGNTESSAGKTRTNFIHNKSIDSTPNKKDVRASLNEREISQNSRNSWREKVDATSRGNDSKKRDRSAISNPEGIKELQNPDIESKHKDYTSKRSQVTITRKAQHTINRGEHKRANTIAILIFVAVLCYGPLAIIYVLRAIRGDTFEIVYIADPWADLILYVNSTINPIIYCLRARELRDAIKRVLPKSLLNFFRAVTRCRRSDVP